MESTQHAQHATEPNRLLRAMPPDEYAALIEYMEPVELPSRYVLWQAEATIRSLYFPRSCVVSFLLPLKDEQPVEAATVGREGMAGTPVLLGVRATNVQAIAQVPGAALRVDAGGWADVPDLFRVFPDRPIARKSSHVRHVQDGAPMPLALIQEIVTCPLLHLDE